MKLNSVKLKNYKSIIDSGNLTLHKEINILAGKNNTGKSAFIEAIYKVINGKKNDVILTNDRTIHIEMDVSLTSDELVNLYEGVDETYTLGDVKRFRLSFEYDNNIHSSCLKKLEAYYSDNFQSYLTNQSTNKNGGIDLKYNIKTLTGGGTTFVGGTPKLLVNLFKLLSSKTVYISGSRYVPQEESSSLHDSLAIDGTNLNAFLYTLHNNEEKIFDNIMEKFNQIFNDVTAISTPIKSGNKTYISIYFDGLDNPIPLSNCGSGYTHVLLLLCVLFTKKESVILFDEPQVFLHPSAEKAIYDLVSEIGEHQYLFTTHSPILINYPVEKNLFHVSKVKGISNYIQLEQMQEILSDIGVNNSDFALSDKVIFVEGETEEIVLPIILSHFGMKQIGYNYRILNMKGTGNVFSKKTAMNNHREKLDLILGGITQSPIPYKIIIDADNRTEEKLREIKENYMDNIVILDRREFENYFLESYKELAEVINSEFEEEVTGPEEVKAEIELISSDSSDRKLYPRETSDILKNIVGSEVLERLFSKYKISFNKVNHGLQLTKLVLERSPEKLEFFKNELQEFIK